MVKIWAEERRSYHGCDGVATRPGDLDTGTAHRGIVPDLTRIGCAVETVGDGAHGGERAGSATDVSTIERRLATDGATRGRGGVAGAVLGGG